MLDFEVIKFRINCLHWHSKRIDMGKIWAKVLQKASSTRFQFQGWDWLLKFMFYNFSKYKLRYYNRGLILQRVIFLVVSASKFELISGISSSPSPWASEPWAIRGWAFSLNVRFRFGRQSSARVGISWSAWACYAQNGSLSVRAVVGGVPFVPITIPNGFAQIVRPTPPRLIAQTF